MLHFFVGCAIGATAVACIGLPFVAPWPMRMRFLVAAQAADPVLGLAAPPGFAMREVSLVAVESRAGHVDVVVDESRVGRGGGSALRTLRRDACPPAVVAMLDGWSALRTPLLLIVDEDGAAHLHGPGGSVTNLERRGAAVR